MNGYDRQHDYAHFHIMSTIWPWHTQEKVEKHCHARRTCVQQHLTADIRKVMCQRYY